MTESHIITPYFIDRPVPELAYLAQPGWEINDPGLEGNDQQSRASGLHRPLADFVTDAAAAGNRPVSIMGDCCATIGVMAGLQRVGVEPTLLWFDAHGDFNTWDTTPSGFLGGMPLAMIVGLGDLTMNRAVGLDPIPSSRVILTDGRDLDPGERDLLDASDVTIVGDPLALLETPLPDGPIYVHFDSDIINCEEAPAQAYPVPGGPSSDELKKVFAHLATSGQVVAVSMTCWTPRLDKDGRSADVCMSTIEALF